jgi:hypothetical protein
MPKRLPRVVWGQTEIRMKKPPAGVRQVPEFDRVMALLERIEAAIEGQAQEIRNLQEDVGRVFGGLEEEIRALGHYLAEEVRRGNHREGLDSRSYARDQAGE